MAGERLLKKLLAPQQVQLLRKIRDLYRIPIIARLYSHGLSRLVAIYGYDK